ncbi:MAG: AsmA family protein [Alphaproteobacteria bacterium]
MRIWVPFAVIGGLIVAVLIAAVILLSTQDVEVYKELIEEQARKATGRELKINGELDLAISFSPAITATDVVFANAEWGSRPEMLKLERVEAKVALIPMLMGTVDVKRLVLVGADIYLETDLSGRGNWEFEPVEEEPEGEEASEVAEAEPEEREEPEEQELEDAELPIVRDVWIEDLVITYWDGETGETTEIVFERLSGSQDEPGGPLSFDLLGRLDEAKIALEGIIGFGEKDIPLRVTGEAAGAALNIIGTIADPMAGKGLDLTIEIEGQTIKSLGALTGGDLPDIGPYRITTRLSDFGEIYRLDDLDMRLGPSDLTGVIELVMGDERPSFSADLNSGLLDLTAYTGAPAAGRPPTGPGNGGTGGAGAESDSLIALSEGGDAAPAASGERLFSDEPFDFSALGSIDGRAKLTAETVRLDKMTISNLDVVIELQSARATVSPLLAHFGGGQLDADLVLNARQATPSFSARLVLADADLGRVTEEMEITDILEGRFDLEADLKGAGGSMHALMASLNGSLSVEMGEGQLNSGYIDYLAADLLSTLTSWGEASDVTRVNCMVARFDIRNGIASASDLLLDTAKMTVSGEGTVDLGKEELDLTLTPRPKEESLISLALPVDIRGPLSDPYVLPNEEAVALGAAALVGQIALGPIGLLIPLVSAGTGDKNPCVVALQEGVAQPTAPPQEEERPGIFEPLKDILDSIF